MLSRPSAFSQVLDLRDTPVDGDTDFQSRAVGSFYRWWQEAADGSPPNRRLFDVTEHKGVVGKLFLVEVQSDGNFLLKLHGEEVIRMFGRNNTGNLVMPGDGSEYGHALHAYYATVVAERRCRICTGTLSMFDRSHIAFESVDCPFVDDSGRVSAIIGVIDKLRR